MAHSIVAEACSDFHFNGYGHIIDPRQIEFSLQSQYLDSNDLSLGLLVAGFLFFYNISFADRDGAPLPGAGPTQTNAKHKLLDIDRGKALRFT